MKKIHPKILGICLTIATLLVFTSCGGGGASEWLESFANGFALASPTAKASSHRGISQRAASFDGTLPLTEKAEKLEDLAKGEAADGCKITLPTLNGLSARAECFGPAVNYTNHPDGGGGSGQLPTGDLGIWSATESNGDACAAAQLNKLISTSASYIDAAMMLEAAAICTLNKEEKEVPGVGESAVDFASEFESLLKETTSAATVKTAEASTPLEGIQQFVFVGTTDGARDFSVTFRIKKVSDTSYQGRAYGYFESTNKDAFSVIFTRSGDDLKIRMLAGTWMSSVEDSTVFDSSGDLKLDGSWHGNMNQAILNVSATDGTGNVSYAWQAGSGDDKTRVFNVYSNSSRGSISGCGFAGYGNEFDATYSNNTNAISGFICNWAGPGNSHTMTGTTGKAQKQCFEQSGSTLSEVTAKRAITYAPTNSCNDGGALTYDWPSHSGDGATNNLITLSSDTDYSSYSAPSAPTLDSGI